MSSLLSNVKMTHFHLDSKKTEGEKAEEADAEILAAIARRRKLASDLELAKGIQYTKSFETSYVIGPSFLCLFLLHAHSMLSVGSHRDIFVSDRRNNTASCGKNTTSSLMARISLHQ
jgi:hypothetical protein